MVLGYDTRTEYAHDSTYFGAAVGRCANRIARGRFSLDGQTYQLACNNGENALHGGPSGFSYREWALDALLGEDGAPLPADAPEADVAGVRLTYTSAAGEEEYPGTLAVTCTYLLRLDDGTGRKDNDGDGDASSLPQPSLLTRFEAHVTGTATIVNLVQHTYWNLGGHDSGSVCDSHVLSLPTANTYLPVDATLIPTGAYARVAGTAFDFTAPKLVGEDAADVPGGLGYDTCFVLGGPNGSSPQ